jgi:N,N'-diacetyllegionaminate synthase
VKIGSREIGPGHPVFVVAEIGLNHNGSVDTALEMVRAAKACGADAVKVQAFAASCFTTARATWKGESQLEMFKRYELPREAYFRIADECRKEGLVFFGTPDCVEHARWLVDAGAEVIKVGSDDLTNTPLLRQLAALGLPMILSTGMGGEDEVERAVNAVTDHIGTVWDAASGEVISHTDQLADVAVLYCCSVYPTPLSSVRFRIIEKLRSSEMWGVTAVGFSDHTEGPTAACVAVAVGATIVEKHFTLDHSMPGPDHQWSADPADFRALVDAIRGTESAFSSWLLDEREVEMRPVARRSIVAARDLPAGHVLTWADIAFKRPGDGLAPSSAPALIGKTLYKALAADDLVTLEVLPCS